MKLQLLVSSGLLALASAASIQAPAPRKSYSGYKVFRVDVGSNADRLNAVVDKLGLSTWKGRPRPNTQADIVVPPNVLEAFEAEVAGLNKVTMHEDLGLSIEDETTFGVYAAGSANATWFNSYHAYADHLQFLKDLQASYPTRSAIVTSGNSNGGRAITGIHFWGSSGKGKPAVVFHGNVHAREWITSMVVEYFAYYMLTNSETAEVKSFLDKYDFIFFPIVNPDGFVYTQTNDRLWRKNRQTNSGSSCIGRDINRNWPYQWSVSGGASTNACAEDYKGKAQSDAPETTALANFLQTTKRNQGVKLFIDWHSYSQLFMTPYGYSCTAVAPKDSELQSLARGVASAIRSVFGTSFKTGPICNTIYKATGNSVDYANDVVGSEYTFTAELRDTGRYGFVLPANQILPSGQEAWAGVAYLLKNMK